MLADLALGVAYALHVIAAYYELARPGRQVQAVVRETIQTSSTPLLLAALTTAVGFLSLLLSLSVSVQAMGLYSAVGIVFAFLLAVVLVPALLSLLRLPPRHEETYAPVLNAALQKLVRAVLHHRAAVLIISGLIVLLSIWPIPSLQVGTNLLTVFPEDHPIRQADAALGQHLAGSLLFYVVVDGASEGIMRKWDTVRRLKELQTYIDSLPGIDKTISFVDACEISDKAIQTLPPVEGEREGEPAGSPQTFWENPDQLNGAIQLLAGMSPSILSRFVDYPRYSRVNIRVRTSLSSPSEIEATVKKIESYAQEHFPSELQVHPTGDLILETRSTGNLIRGQIQSLTLTAVVIFGLLSLMFLSVRIGALAMIPNLFPIVVFFGLMGVSGAVLSASPEISGLFRVSRLFGLSRPSLRVMWSDPYEKQPLNLAVTRTARSPYLPVCVLFKPSLSPSWASYKAIHTVRLLFAGVRWARKCTSWSTVRPRSSSLPMTNPDGSERCPGEMCVARWA